MTDPARPPFRLAVHCHRRLRGPYTGGGALLRLVVPDLMALDPALVAPQVNAVVAAAPDLVDRVPPASQTLTNTASVEERTRFYSAQRTREIAHGIAQVVDVWAARCHPEGVEVVLAELDQADPTDVELADVLALRLRPGRAWLGASPAGPGPGRTGPTDEADAYVRSDGTTDDPVLRAAYDRLEPAERRRRHDDRAAELVRTGEPGAGWGAVPYHRERGTDPLGAGVDALLAALLSCFNGGYYDACIDFAERGRALLAGGERAADRIKLTQKLIGSLTYVDQGEAARELVGELRRTSYDLTEQMRCHYTLAMLYTRHLPPALRDEDEALGFANTAIALADGHHDPKRRAFFGAFMRNGRALVETHRGNLTGALDLVDAAIDVAESDLEAGEYVLHRTVLVHNRGRVLVGLKRFDEALVDLDEVVRRDPEFDEAYFDRAGAFRASGDLGSALADYTRAIELSVNFAEAYYNRADTLLELGERAAALADLDVVLTLTPEHPAALVNRAGLRLEDGDLDGAGADIRRGLVVAPDDPQLWSASGLLAAERGDEAGAWDAYSRALELDPDLVDALGNRAILAFTTGRIEQSLADLDRALGVREDGALRLNRAIARQQIGDHPGALADLAAAARLPGADLDELAEWRQLSVAALAPVRTEVLAGTEPR